MSGLFAKTITFPAEVTNSSAPESISPGVNAHELDECWRLVAETRSLLESGFALVPSHALRTLANSRRALATALLRRLGLLANDSGRAPAAAVTTAAARDRLRRMFEDLDADGSGGVDPAELATALADMGVAMPRADLDRLFAVADADGSGAIDFEEFASLGLALMREHGVRILPAAAPTAASAGGGGEECYSDEDPVELCPAPAKPSPRLPLPRQAPSSAARRVHTPGSISPTRRRPSRDGQSPTRRLAAHSPSRTLGRRVPPGAFPRPCPAARGPESPCGPRARVAAQRHREGFG